MVVFKEKGSILGWLTYVNIKPSKPIKHEKVSMGGRVQDYISCIILSSKNTFARYSIVLAGCP